MADGCPGACATRAVLFCRADRCFYCDRKADTVDDRHPTKITFAQMRDSGVRAILIYCAD
jgi:hypothetical protein